MTDVINEDEVISMDPNPIMTDILIERRNLDTQIFIQEECHVKMKAELYQHRNAKDRPQTPRRWTRGLEPVPPHHCQKELTLLTPGS